MSNNYTIKPSECGRYIILTVKGEINNHIAMKQNKEAHALGTKLGISNYLVDVTNAVNNTSVKEQYDFAYNNMQNEPEVDKRAKIAFVSSPNDSSHDFIETVSINAGLNVRMFKDMEAARNYLLED